MHLSRYSWLAVATLMFALLGNPALAIDNPDAPDLVAGFEVREKPFIAAIESPKNSTRDYAVTYTKYLEFLDKELNTIYKTLRITLSESQQKQLKASQISWLKYRDLEFELIDNTWTTAKFGTSSAISRGQYKANIVRNRLIQLTHYAQNF